MTTRLPELVECVMNVSEGRDLTKIRAIAAALEEQPDCFLLNLSSDPDHHRTVLSFVGSPEGIERGALSAIFTGITLIDLRTHSGVHPRIGAVDVVPFVPLRGVAMADCVRIARRVGSRVAAEAAVPVYLYEEAAIRPDRSQLPDIRRGGFEGLGPIIAVDPYRRPDYGEARLHPTAGAVVIGARRALIAFNVYLDTDDPLIARQIARAIRERDGGLPWVRAMGFKIAHREQAQVSVNLRDFRVTPLLAVWQRTVAAANELGVEPVSSEIIGLAPRAAFPSNPVDTLRLTDFNEEQVLERRISEVLGEPEAELPGLWV